MNICISLRFCSFLIVLLGLISGLIVGGISVFFEKSLNAEYSFLSGLKKYHYGILFVGITSIATYYGVGGVLKRKGESVLIWIILQCTFLYILILYICYSFLEIYLSGTRQNDYQEKCIGVYVVAFCIVWSGCVYIVNKFYKQLNSNIIVIKTIQDEIDNLPPPPSPLPSLLEMSPPLPSYPSPEYIGSTKTFGLNTPVVGGAD